jgi:predicted dehydrogenase
MNRRDALSTSGLALAASLYPAGVHFADVAKPKRAGLIGCGWYGKCDLLRLMQVADVDVVSLCDVDKKMLDGAAKLVGERQKVKKKPRLYGDYRKMLAEKDLDIVLIGTPDHWHALPMIEAVAAGADVYVQKPISVDVAEGQAMVAAARKHKRVVQVGTQRRSTPHLVEARNDVLKEGKLGKIGLVEIYCYYPMRNGETPPVTKPPEYFDYEMWTGPAPKRPYDCPVDPDSPDEHRLPHRRWWRAFTEYGNGIVGDMCIHMLDMVRWMLDLGWPKSISSTGGILVQKKARSNISDTQTATFDYGDLKVVWQHRTWGAAPDPKDQWGATFYGEKGTLKANVNNYDFRPLGGKQKPIRGSVKLELDKYPEDKTEKDLERHAAPANREHQRDFLKAIATRGRPVADVEQGHISTACCILANLSMELGRSLRWDEKKGRVIDDEAANTRLKRPYRKGWTHPAG